MCVTRNKYLRLRASMRLVHGAARGILMSVMLRRQQKLNAAARSIQVR